MSNKERRELAEHIARAIFARPQGFEYLGPVVRIQYLHGEPERTGGGLCLGALEDTIYDALTAKETP